MNVIWLLIKASGLNVAIAILTGLISGGCSAQLIALINRAVSGNSTDNLIGYFVGLALLALLTSIISQFLLIDLAQGAVYNLRLRLSQGILSAPLRHLEEIVIRGETKEWLLLIYLNLQRLKIPAKNFHKQSN